MEGLPDRNNNELVAVYGNFVNRALQLTKKYFNGIVPECGQLLDVDNAAIEEFQGREAEGGSPARRLQVP